MTDCVICSATTDDETVDGWTAWTLDEPIQWLSAFAHTGQMPVTAAGRYAACPVCTPWIPRHRAGNLPAVVRDGFERLACIHPEGPTRRRLRAELVGQARHLASQLQPTPNHREDQP